MFKFPWDKKKEKPMPEQVKVADKNLPLNIKNLSVKDLAAKINKVNQPNKWAITRFAASGKMDKKYVVGGNQYPSGYTSKQKRKRIQRQIEKGMIQVTPDRVYKSSKQVVKQEAVDERDGKVL